MAAWVVPVATMAMSVIQGMSSASAAKKAAQNEAAWIRYNAQMAHGTALGNIAAQIAIAKFTSDIGLETAEMENSVLLDITEYNANIMEATTVYNVHLLENDLINMWDAFDLDLYNLENERARERGQIVAFQSASGTIIDDGSNAAIIVSEKAQENLDAFVIRHGADIQAAKIENSIARNKWEGKTKVEQLIWEGEVQALVNMTNARAKSIGDMGLAYISADAQLQSARSNIISGAIGAQQVQNAGQVKANNAMTTGLFNAAKTGVSSYYQYKTPGTQSPDTTVEPAGGGHFQYDDTE